MSDRMREYMPDKVSECLPEHLPEDMPGRMPEAMPEDMSDRMPEDLPVTKCININVMVGITRSKVFFHCTYYIFTIAHIIYIHLIIHHNPLYIIIYHRKQSGFTYGSPMVLRYYFGPTSECFAFV